MGTENGGEAAQQQTLQQRKEGAHLFARRGVAQFGPVLGVAEISVWERDMGVYPIGNFQPTSQT